MATLPYLIIEHVFVGIYCEKDIEEFHANGSSTTGVIFTKPDDTTKPSTAESVSMSIIKTSSTTNPVSVTSWSTGHNVTCYHAKSRHQFSMRVIRPKQIPMQSDQIHVPISC